MVTPASAQDFLLDPIPDTIRLPDSTDMRLVAGDRAAFIRRFCGSPLNEASTCEVFYQADPSGTLVGYMSLTSTHTGTILEVRAKTREGRDCSIGGALEDITTADFQPLPHGRTTSDFIARLPMSIITSRTRDGSPNFSYAMFYIERVALRVRLNDERWNHCYRSSNIEDVWLRLGGWQRPARVRRDGFDR